MTRLRYLMVKILMVAPLAYVLVIVQKKLVTKSALVIVYLVGKGLVIYKFRTNQISYCICSVYAGSTLYTHK